jgi:hypothetical protein
MSDGIYYCRECSSEAHHDYADYWWCPVCTLLVDVTASRPPGPWQWSGCTVDAAVTTECQTHEDWQQCGIVRGWATGPWTTAQDAQRAPGETET